MKTVKVTANPETGKVFTQQMNADGTPHLDKNGEEHGYIRVESKKANLGFAYKGGVKVRSLLIGMTKKAYAEVADFYTAGSIHEGQIIREDRLEPWFDGQKPLETANGVIITSNGAPVYRRESFTESLTKGDSKLDSYDQVVETVAETAAKGEVLND